MNRREFFASVTAAALAPDVPLAPEPMLAIEWPASSSGFEIFAEEIRKSDEEIARMMHGGTFVNPECPVEIGPANLEILKAMRARVNDSGGVLYVSPHYEIFEAPPDLPPLATITRMRGPFKVFT
jgi:hypothetical protein